MEIANLNNEYVNWIAFSKTHGIIMTGKLVGDILSSEIVQTFNGSWDLWFYNACEGNINKPRSIDYIPIAQYLFRNG